MTTETENTNEHKIEELFLNEVKFKLFEEYWPRLLKCLDECDEEILWYRPNENSNSIGNLVLHLEGNARQWIVHGIGGAEDKRKRAEEFKSPQEISKQDLFELLDRLKSDIINVLLNVKYKTLIRRRLIQNFDTNGLGALFHVVEHFSYHLGQITYIVKALKNKDMGYYSGHTLD